MIGANAAAAAADGVAPLPAAQSPAAWARTRAECSDRRRVTRVHSENGEEVEVGGETRRTFELSEGVHAASQNHHHLPRSRHGAKPRA